MTHSDSLPPEVHDAIRSFLQGHESGVRIEMTTAIAAIRGAYPDLILRDEDLADAIAGQAEGEQIAIQFDRGR